MSLEDTIITDTEGETEKFVTFMLGNEEFGADVLQTKEISNMKKITEVPTAPSFVEGVINLRGAITPILDLRKRLDLETREDLSDSQIVITEQNEHFIGMIVDEVVDVIEIPKDNIDSAPDIIMTDVSEEYIRGVGKVGEDRLIVILDLSQVLSKGEFAKVKKAKQTAKSSQENQ